MRVLLVFFFLSWFDSSKAQESPKFSVPKFDNRTSHRTNVCAQQVMLWNETVDLPNALRGLDLTVGITDYRVGKETDFFSLKDGKIPEDYPGYFAVILDEVADRAGFTWRNSFGVYPARNQDTDGDKSWTDILVWAINTYDISMEKWGHSVDRMSLGASFPLGYWDSSAILGEIFEPSQRVRVVRLWSFLDPFETMVWVAIGVAIVLTGLTYWVLEFWNKDTDERDLDGKPVASIFYAAIAFTGHYELRPNSHSARILGFSFTFWSLIVGSAYTANLASFMVSQQKALFKYSTIEDAKRRDAHLCVQGGAILQTILEAKYPGIKTVGKDSEQSIFESLRVPVEEGGCNAVAHQFNSFEIYQHTKLVNNDCAINSEKRIVEVLPAGMATLVDNGPISDDPDSKYKCTSLISHVLDYHLTAMANDGFLEAAWNDHLQRIGTIECIHESFSGGGVEDTVSLSVQDVGGIFIVHAILSFIAMALSVYQFYEKSRKAQLQDERTLESVFGINHAREMLAKTSMRGGGSEAENEALEDTSQEKAEPTARMIDTSSSNHSVHHSSQSPSLRKTARHRRKEPFLESTC